MKLRLLLPMLSLAICLGCGSKSAPPPQPTQEPSIGSSKSANWDVELVSVKEKKDYSDPSLKTGVISLKLRIEYLGPTGAVTAPMVSIGYSEGSSKVIKPVSGLSTEGGQTDPEKMKVLEWLVANQFFALVRSKQERQSMQLERGMKLDGVLNFDYPRDLATAFKLGFGDVPPIPFDVRRAE